MEKYWAKEVKTYHKIPKLSPVRPITLKIKPTKNTIPDLRIKTWYLAIKELKIFTVSGVLPPAHRISYPK